MELLKLSIDLGRFETAEKQKLLTILKKLEAELIAELKAVDPTEPRVTTFQLQRVEKLLAAVQETITSAYRSIATEARRDLKQLAVLQAENIQGIVAELTLDSMFSVLPSEATLRALTDNTIVLGKRMQQWWRSQAIGLRDDYLATVRSGVIRGDSLNKIVQSLRGTMEARFTDGLFAKHERHLSTLVRTSINSISNESRIKTFHDNSDVIKGIEFLTSLDDAVCPVCRPYSGQAYTLDGRRLPGTKLPFPGNPPLHGNCRCMWLPVIREYRQLRTAKGPRFQAQIDALDQGTKDQLDGGLGADLSLPVWLRTQPEAMQKRILGEARWALWKRGRLPLQSMVSAATGRPLTLAQLKARRRRVVA